MPAPSQALFSFLYSSVLNPAHPASCVASIVRRARDANARQQLTGLLVFDGQRFCQYLEGPRRALDPMLERIQADPRHHQFVLQQHGPLPAARMFQDWAIAYAEIDSDMPLHAIATLDGATAIARLHELLPSLDYC